MSARLLDALTVLAVVAAVASLPYVIAAVAWLVGAR